MAEVSACTSFPEIAVLNVDSNSRWETENCAGKQE